MRHTRCLPWSVWPMVLAFLGLLACSAPALADARTLDLAQSPGDPAYVAPYFDFLDDATGTLAIADMLAPAQAARFQPAQGGEALNFGITGSSIWLRLSLHNSGANAIERLLEIAYPRLAVVDFHIQHGDQLQHIESGYARPFAHRPVAHRHFVFPVSLAAGADATVYLHLQSFTSLEVPARLWSEEHFRAYERLDYATQSAYFGMAAAMILFNLLLFVSLRDRGYLFYLIFAVSNFWTAASITGIGTEYLWPDAVHWTTISYAVFGHLTCFGLMIFSRHMLDVPRLLARRNAIAFDMLMAMHLLLAAYQFHDYVVRATIITAGGSTLLIFALAIHATRLGQRGGRLFLAAFTMVLLAVFVSMLRIGGVVPTNFYTQNGIQIGAAIEMILLAFALADRFNAIRADRERAQAEALLAERRLVDGLRHSERVLEARVAERTAELSATVARLEQAGQDLAEAEKLASLGSLVAGVAHELNTPIGNALTTATALEHEAQGMRAQVAAGAIRRSVLEGFIARCADMADLLTRSCQRAAELISSFKQVAVDQTSEQKRAFLLDELVGDNIAALRPSHKHARWTFENTVPPGIRCESYPGPLGQVISNLLQNAALHAFELGDPGSITVSALREDAHVVITVSDTGKGMTADVLARIWEPFFTTRLGQGGSGLGLAICRNIVSGVLGGTLNAASAPGQGTRFVLRMPLAAPERIDAEPPRQRSAAGTV